MTETPYGLTVEVDATVEAAEAAMRDALAEEGFGILTEIDVEATLAAKLGVEREPYKILGACNPALANEALGVDESIGLLLPCNVVVYRSDESTVVSILDPEVMSRVADAPGLDPVVKEARSRLERALDSFLGSIAAAG